MDINSKLKIAAPDKMRCIVALNKLLLSHEGIYATMLALRDGRPYVEKHRRAFDGGKFAAMASSLVALSHTVLRDLESGPLDHVLIEGGSGKLVITNIPESNGLLILAVLAAHDVRLGLVLGYAKTCAMEVSVTFPAVR
jgi:predicted regulator of Ras-like GTPase activity (Roadblock/LC7/MglB family)